MLERTTRTYLDDILSKDFSSLQDNNLIALEQKRSLRIRLKNSNAHVKEDEQHNKSNTDDSTMTRKTRTRRPRITVIQSGYCAVCNLPYNNVEDHIQSKKHQKLIGEDANYIALNGSLNGFLQTNNIPFLNLNGIDAIGVHDNSLDDFSTKYRRRAMRKTRAASVACERVKPSPLSPTGSEVMGHHHLRSRRNINYMTPPLDDDSLQDSLDICLPPEEPATPVFKEYRELRSSTRALAKLTEPVPEIQEEVWSSGRPKRSCIRTKRLSLDDHANSNCKTYYKVEVMTGKAKSHSTDQEKNKRLPSQSPKRDESRKDTGLIVKFKKLRNSELIQLNNEATNFLFPKKEDSDREEDEISIDDSKNINISSVNERSCNSITASESEDCGKKTQKIKVEDETSVDSVLSQKVKKKRRTHAEAFILDNQKYYKFETPGSRLRYHGSYLPPIIKSFKHNGQLSSKMEEIKTEEMDEKEPDFSDANLKLNEYKFCFERIPSNAAWYKTFQRVDRGEQRYRFLNNCVWDPYILPFQMPRINPVDKKSCMTQYLQCLRTLRETVSRDTSVCSSPEPCASASTPLYEPYMPDIDEDSKMSAITSSSVCSNEDAMSKKSGLLRSNVLQPITSGKNPRKSPRQHASTLAILSSLLNQRKRRSRNKTESESNPSLPVIPEESSLSNMPFVEEDKSERDQEKLEQVQDDLEQAQDKLEEAQDKLEQVPDKLEQSQENLEEVLPQNTEEGGEQPKMKAATPNKFHWRFRPRVSYQVVSHNIENELNSALNDFEKYSLEGRCDAVDFHNTRVNTSEILRIYEESKAKETDKSCRRFFNGAPGRKPGRKRKKNLTGWPNKNKRIPKREGSKDKQETLGKIKTPDRVSVHEDSNIEEEDEEPKEDEVPKEDELPKEDEVPKVDEEPKEDIVAKKEKESVCVKNNNENDCCDIDRVNKVKKTLIKKVKNEVLQPYVYVQKLDNKLIDNQIFGKKRSEKKSKRTPSSPKSPRKLRKPRGRWYKER